MKQKSHFSQAGLLVCMFLSSLGATGEETTNWADLPNFDETRAERGARDDFGETCGTFGHAAPDDPTVSYLDEGNWAAAESAARIRLESCPVDIRFHIYMAVALDELGRETESEVHIAWANGLLDSILDSGDGQSVESAYVTISVAEEYEILSAFGLRMTSQAIVEGRDRFEATDEDGEEYVIYFFPEQHWVRLEKMFHGPTKAPD